MKAYVKPELFYERYELSQHIADCAWEMSNLTDEKTCYAVADQNKIPSTERLFTTNAGCTATTDDGVYSEYCYQGGAAHANVFIS